MFDVNGQLFFPNLGINPMTHPFWIPEFLGDTIVVNGKVWPYHAVDRQRYRFLFLNGSNARGYEMLLKTRSPASKGPSCGSSAPTADTSTTPRRSTRTRSTRRCQRAWSCCRVSATT